MQIMDKLRNLLVMAASDGKLTEREINFLSDRCQRWGIADSEFAAAIQEALSPDAEVVIPPGQEDRLLMLRDLIGMMAADGKLAEVEIHLFAVVAARMGIAEQELNQLIDSMTGGRQKDAG